MNRINLIKRAFCIMMIVALLAICVAPAFAASNKNPSGAYVVTSSGSLRLRSGPGKGYSVLTKLKKGTVVVYRGRTNGWWRVMYSGGSGYVDRRYVTSVLSLPNAKYTPTDNLRVRAKASSDSAVIGKLKVGKKVTIVKQKGTWACIKSGTGG